MMNHATANGMTTDWKVSENKGQKEYAIERKASRI